MKDWSEHRPRRVGTRTQAIIGELIRRDQARTDKIAEMQRFVGDGIRSGLAGCSQEDLFAAATDQTEISRGRA